MTTVLEEKSLGSWTHIDVKNACQSVNDGKKLLQQPLQNIVTALLPTAKLAALSQQTMPKMNDTGVEDNTSKVGKFDVFFGNQKLHELASPFCDDGIHFNEMLIKFYIDQFTLQETANIRRIFDYENALVQHLVIYMNYYMKSRKGVVVLNREVIASASFIIGQHSCYLLYITAKNAFVPETHYTKTTTNTPTAGSKSVYLRNQGLEMFLLAMVQEITLRVTNKSEIVCEATKADSQKAFFFYKRLLFHHVLPTDPSVNYFRIRHKELFHDEFQLKWLVSTQSIAATNTSLLYASQKKLLDIRRAIDFATDIFFRSNKKYISDDFLEYSNFQDQFVHIFNENVNITIPNDGVLSIRTRSRGKKTASLEQLKDFIGISEKENEALSIESCSFFE
jgi:hypothetical protein